MKNLVYLLLVFIFLFAGSAFTFDFPDGNNPFENATLPLALDVKIEQPQSTTSNDGALQLFVSGGKAPYLIQVISTYSPSQVYKKERVEIKKLGVGKYIIMVQDAEKEVLQKTIELNPVQ